MSTVPIEKLRIKKLRTDPYLAYPQFDRYLTGAQLKVVNTLLRFGAADGNAFPSNDRISFETGLDPGTVRNTKVQLVKLGVLTKTETTQGNRTLWLYTVDTTWNRERYQWEFEERYRTETQTDSARSIKDEIGRLQQALSNASPTDMLKIIERIKELTLQMQNGESKPKEQAKTTPEPAPVEEEQSKEAPDDEEERFMDFLVAEHAPERPIAWRNWAKQAIKKGEFVGIDDYRREFDERQTIRAITEYLKKEVPRLEFGKSQQVFAGLVHYSSEKARYLANYGGHEVQVSPETVQKALTQMIETQQQR